MSHINQVCRITGNNFIITEEEQQFYQDVAPVFNNRKCTIPLPVICPEERRRQRLSFRNQRYMYYRKCDLTGKKILSCYDRDVIQPVYNSSDWWSDKWDPLEYGRNFDFNRSFFEQFADLYREVPVIHHYVINSENCEYVNGASDCKDCYLSFNLDFCEKVFYVNDAKYSNYCLDSYNILRCEWCYECIDCENCYHLKFSTRCSNCSDSLFLENCKRCNNCIGCCNLIDKEYYVFNEKVTLDEFRTLKKRLTTISGIQEFEKKFKEFSIQFPKKYYTGHSNENFSGDNIHNAKNCYNCFQTFEIEDCSHCYYIFQANNCMDYDVFGMNAEWMYNCLANGKNTFNNICCIGNWNGSSNNLYCNLMGGSSNNFGCCGLKKKQYSILNKQYSKEEYEEVVPKIIKHMSMTGEWGQFFPIDLSPFAYNETLAHEFHPLTRDEAEKRAFKWKEIKTEKSDVSNDILDCAIKCEITGKLFRIIPQELKFYQQEQIPIPRKHPDQRHKERFDKRNPLHLWDRKCDKCNTDIQTSYSPDRTEKVYCEGCYLKEVY